MSERKKTQPTLTRNDLVKSVSDEIGNASAAHALVKDFFELTEQALIEKGQVKMHNFGCFETSAKNERVGRNPSNGVQMKITARTVVKFRPSNKLREAVRNDAEPDTD